MIRRDRFNWVDIDDLASATLLNPNATQTEQTLASFIKDNRIIERLDGLDYNLSEIEEIRTNLGDLDALSKQGLLNLLKWVDSRLEDLYWGDD